MPALNYSIRFDYINYLNDTSFSNKMAKQEFHIDYCYSKFLFRWKHPNLLENKTDKDKSEKFSPYFELAVGDVGGEFMPEPDLDKTTGLPIFNYDVISQPENLLVLMRDILQYLKQPASLQNYYQVTFSESALSQIGEIGKQGLEGILGLHNALVYSKLVSPKRT